MSGSRNSERDAQLLAIGQQCSAPSCLLVDFLPFRCQHCRHSFCRDHYLPEQHKCAHFDASLHDRIAPSCPLCNTAVAIPPGQDPNIRMEAHINSECSVTTGKSRKSSSPVCAKAKCGKVLFAPIPCDKCKQRFCPQHRFPTTHNCVTSSASTAGRPSSRAIADMSTRASEASSAAMAAIQRAMAVTNLTSAADATSGTVTSPDQRQPQPPHIAKSSSSSSSTRSNPFSQTDRSSASYPCTSTSAFDDNDRSRRCSPNTTANYKLDLLSYVPRPLFPSA